MRIFYLLIFLLISCEKYNLPKQKGYLAHQFNKPEYELITTDCNFSFMINKKSEINHVSNCNIIISYAKLKAEIFLSNLKINENIELLIQDFNTKIQENSNTINKVNVSEFNDIENNKFGLSYFFEGNAPSNIQFHVTDSISNFLVGSLYFRTKPNFDSLMPSIFYIENDIKKIIETLRW